MRWLSDVCDELEDNTIHSRECAKCKGVSHHICPRNLVALYLQRGITHITVYCSKYCMMSMEQATATDGNEEITAIESTIEFYYKRFKEINARNQEIIRFVFLRVSCDSVQ